MNYNISQAANTPRRAVVPAHITPPRTPTLQISQTPTLAGPDRVSRMAQNTTTDAPPQASPLASPKGQAAPLVSPKGQSSPLASPKGQAAPLASPKGQASPISHKAQSDDRNDVGYKFGIPQQSPRVAQSEPVKFQRAPVIPQTFDYIPKTPDAIPADLMGDFEKLMKVMKGESTAVPTNTLAGLQTVQPADTPTKCAISPVIAPAKTPPAVSITQPTRVVADIEPVAAPSVDALSDTIAPEFSSGSAPEFSVKVPPPMWEMLTGSEVSIQLHDGTSHNGQTVVRIYPMDGDKFFSCNDSRGKIGRQTRKIAFSRVSAVWKLYPVDSRIEFLLLQGSLRAAAKKEAEAAAEVEAIRADIATCRDELDTLRIAAKKAAENSSAKIAALVTQVRKLTEAVMKLQA